jgi:TRAP-type C4-dicarboxylate transport system substrate-binding protein
MNKKQTCVFLLMLLSILVVLDIGNTEAVEGKKASTILLRYATPVSGMGPDRTFMEKAASEVERLTEGRIKIEIYWGGSLLKSRDILRGVERGVCNMGFIGPLWYPAELPIGSAYGSLLYVPKANDPSWTVRKAWEIWDKCKDLQAEYKKYGQTVWYIHTYDPYVLYSNKPVKTCEDIKGMRIKVTGEAQGKMINSIGGIAIQMLTAEVYSALEKGTIDGCLFGTSQGKRYGYYEVVHNVTMTDLFIMYAYTTVANRDLERMSKKDRETFLQVGRTVSIRLGEEVKKVRGEDIEYMRKKGANILPFSLEERAKWAEVPKTKDLIKNWIDEQNAAGQNGTEVMRLFLKTFEVPQWMPPGY